MADQLQLRGGTTNEHSTFTGALREVTVDTDKDTLIVHDAATAGGHPLLREDGSNSALSLGTAGTPSIKFTGDTNTGLYSPGADQVAISTGGSGRLFVDSSGQVGVGTSAPSQLLEVRGSSGIMARFRDSTNGIIDLRTTGSTNSDPVQIDAQNRPLSFAFNASETMRIDTDGRVGIGTSSPATNLTIQGSDNSEMLRLYGGGTGNTRGLSIATYQVGGSVDNAGVDFNAQQAAVGQLRFSTLSTPRMLIDQLGRVGVGTTSPGGLLDVTEDSNNGNGTDNATVFIESLNRNGRLHLVGNASSGAQIYFGDQAYNFAGRIEYLNVNDSMIFGTNGSASNMVIDSSGRVGVGTSSPEQALEVIGNIYLRSSETASTGKTQRLYGGAYADNPMTMVYSNNDASFNRLYLGGGTSGGEPASHIYFYTGTVGTKAAGTARMIINPDGNVGVGTTSPAAKLHVYDASSALAANLVSGQSSCILKLSDANTTDQVQIYSSGNDLTFRTDLGNYTWRTNNAASEAMRIDSSGRVGIGTSTPGTGTSTNGNQLVIANAGSASSRGGLSIYNGNAGLGSIYFADTDSATVGAIQYDHSNNSLNIRVNDSNHATIDSSGRVGIGTTSPSGRLDIDSASDTYLNITTTSGTSGAGISILSNANQGFVGYQNALRFGTITGKNAGGWNERARIDSSGRLLVGTSSAPSSGSGQYAKLVSVGNTITAAGDGRLALARGNTANNLVSGAQIATMSFCDSAGGDFASIEVQADAVPGTGDYPGRLVFSTTADGASSPTERMRITHDGYIVIGTTNVSPGANNTADGHSFKPDGRAYHSANAAVAVYANRNSSTGTVISLRYNGTERGTISTDGTVIAYNTSSDYRLKENVAAVTDGITRLQQLKPSRFNFIDNPAKTVDGFIAHEVQDIVPEAVTGEKDAVDDEGNPEYQGIDQSKLVPLLTAALQEAIGEIESLKARVAALEAN